MATALLVIDVQVGCFTGEEIPPIHEGDALLAKISRLIDRARSSGTPVIYVQHTDDDDFRGTPAWEIHPAIAPAPGEAVVEKLVPDSFHETTLLETLQAQDITDLVICGLQTEICIDTTTRRAFSLGYNVTLVGDAHSTWPAGDLTASQIIAHHNHVLGDWFAALATTDEVSFAPS